MKPIFALLTALAVLPAAAHSPESTDGVLRIAATRSTDAGLVPVAGLTLRLVRVADTTQRILLSTRVDGQALVIAPAGDYRLRSLAAMPLDQIAVAWDVPVTILHDRVTRLDLTERNAAPWDTLSGALEEERRWLERSRGGTVRLIAGVTKGTGIHLDTLDGLVVATTDFVGEARVVAVTGSGEAVAANEVVRDTATGLVLLRLPAGVCPECAPLRIADPTDAHPGDPIAVLARPPHQEPVVVTGRLTVADGDTLATTVSPIPPLAGGALVDRQGAVLGVFTCLCGLGVGRDEERRRVIPASRLAPLLARATEAEATGAPQAADPLPATPEPSSSMTAVRAAADTATPKVYDRFVNQEAGNFRVSLITPTYLLVRLRIAQQRLGSSPDWQALADEQRVARASGYGTDWLAAFGEVTVPAVAIDVTPEAGQSTGGALRRALLPGTNANVRFKADLEHTAFIRNGVPYEPIAGARLPLRVDFEYASGFGGKTKMRDATRWGYYLLPPEMLMPDSLGAPPSIVLKLFDARHQGESTVYELHGDVVARAWNDFAPYYRALRPGEAFRTAVPARFRSRLREVRGR